MKGLFRGTVVACLLAGVVLVSSGFAVVSGAKVAKPGGVCGKAGARVVSQSVSLVCKKKVSGKLAWRVVKASTTSTTTTTTVTSTKNSAPKVAVVAPRVVSASAATGNAVITIADMSPDTGVYAVQWVPVGQSFNSYQMYRTTTKTMTVPYLSCTRTYTLRVFVMQENWQMTDGFVNQNVTPHSATFDLTMPACSATVAAAATTTTVALTCATGGTCIVGDTGPGGGIVFYVHDDADDLFTSTGSDCDTTCKYLEAAPTGWGNGITVAAGETTGTSTVDPKLKWCNTTLLRNETSKTAIGDGRPNTTSSTNNVAACATGAIFHAELYAGNGKTDWHLPSKDELNELFLKKDTVGGFSTGDYWSSSEYVGGSAWYQSFSFGFRGSSYKVNALVVRPVRAF